MQGSWQGNLPHGAGTYTWADGGSYEGQWDRGLKHGEGRYKWPNGSVYEGGWSEGCMQGMGRYVAPEGVTYQGSYLADKKHGLGKKVYANGDTFEGLWKDDLPEGLGVYKWAVGDEYNGEWHEGQMHGQGTFVWSGGERYDGEWLRGLEDGGGVFTWPEGSAYKGTWTLGRKHGVGVWWRANDKEHRKQTATPGGSSKGVGDSNRDAVLSVSGVVGPSPSGVQSPPASSTGSPLGTDGSVVEVGVPSIAERLREAAAMGKVILREYKRGKLMREEWVPREVVPLPDLAQLKNRSKKHRAQLQGERIIKGHRSYDLMLNLQLGIRHSVGKVMSTRKEPLSDRDFDPSLCEELFFPNQGSPVTPPHNSSDFRWKDYGAAVWRYLRESYNCDPGDYMLSICGNEALRELSSPGKSGSIFYISHDDQFMIKSMKKEEMKLLCSILPQYYRHMTAYRDTLVPKFYGLHRINKPSKGRRVRFVVMSNIFDTTLPIHRRFDLKGSTQGRLTTKEIKESTILKDLDLDCTFKLEMGWRARLLEQMQIDCALLEELQVMDYSLLLGVHYRDARKASGPLGPERPLGPADSLGEGDEEDDGLDELPSGARSHSTPGGGTYDSQLFSSLMRSMSKPSASRGRTVSRIATSKPSRSQSMRPQPGMPGSTDELSVASGFNVQLGLNMSAVAIPNDPTKGQPQDVVLFFGIIDILQEYNLRKRAEHASKSIYVKREAMSSVNPTVYATRFQNFMRQVFA